MRRNLNENKINDERFYNPRFSHHTLEISRSEFENIKCETHFDTHVQEEV